MHTTRSVPGPHLVAMPANPELLVQYSDNDQGNIGDTAPKHTPHTLMFLLLLHTIPKTQGQLITHLLTAPNLLIPVKWKNSSSPTIREWITKVDTLKNIEQIQASISHKLTLFQEIWGPWTRFLSKPNTDT
ncbi:Hypothetical predicted protein [Pelobates cultripes]|uniref:Uncharacterized protein n=1 Tax=Pelobates cultripes TaxID=61616 RepID=A0AAD1S284_PELCU|nr:Hypothetical predicted protein [Pelobates cultripes]